MNIFSDEFKFLLKTRFQVGMAAVGDALVSLGIHCLPKEFRPAIESAIIETAESIINPPRRPAPKVRL